MSDYQDWYFQVFKSRFLPKVWFAAAKRDPFMYENRLMAEPGELFFETGETGDEALAKLKRSLNIAD